MGHGGETFFLISLGFLLRENYGIIKICNSSHWNPPGLNSSPKTIRFDRITYTSGLIEHFD